MGRSRHDTTKAFVAGKRARVDSTYDEGGNALGINQGNCVGVPKWENQAFSVLGLGASNVDVCSPKSSIAIGENVREPI